MKIQKQETYRKLDMIDDICQEIKDYIIKYPDIQSNITISLQSKEIPERNGFIRREATGRRLYTIVIGDKNQVDIIGEFANEVHNLYRE